MYCAGLLLVMGQHELGYLNVPILSCKQRLNQLRAGPEWSHPSNVVLLHHNNTNTKNNSDRLLFICTSKAGEKEKNKRREHDNAFVQLQVFFLML